MTALAAAFALGFIGSGHCAAMCGPLVSFMAPTHASWRARWTYAAGYHGGRLMVYAAIGAIAGAIGQVAVVAGLGQVLAVATGGLLIWSAVGVMHPRWWSGAGARAAGIATTLLRRFRGWTIAHRLGGPVTSGAINGLLPCGLVYGAVAAAVGLGTSIDGVAFMLAFGLGTAPALLALGLSRGLLAWVLPVRVRRLAPLALAVVGILLIVRGLAGPVMQAHADGPGAHVAHSGRR